MKKLNILLFCMILLTACSNKDVYNPVEVVKPQAQSVEEVTDGQTKEKSMDWSGKWIGANSQFYFGSELIITQGTDSSFKFQLAANNGSHEGGHGGSAEILADGVAIHELKDTSSYSDDVYFIFILDDEKGKINLRSNDYEFNCGMGTSFDREYVRELNIERPSAIDRDIVDTPEQEQIFKELTGEGYDHLIEVAQYYSEDYPDFGDYRIRTYGVYGAKNLAVVMLDNKNNNIIAVIDGTYYSTDDKYKNKRPKFIEEWIKGENHFY